MNSKVLKFEVDNIEEISNKAKTDYEKAKQSRFAKVKIRLFSTGENTHTEPVEMEALERSADSAYDIPLIAELNPYRGNNDFGGHGVLTGSEFSFGFIKEAEDNPIVYEKDEKTGKVFLTLYGLIWRKYFKNIVNILTDKGNKTEVSVELEELGSEMSSNGKPKLKQFVLNAVTFLGNVTTAACKGAMAELCFSDEINEEFLQDKNKYFEQNFDNTIKIDNSKESAVNGKWSNPRQKLLNPIISASNRISLLKEAYLFCEDTSKEVNLSDVSYPHHIIKEGKLVLHIRGVQSAFSRLSQQDKVEGKAKAHILRHYRELGLNTENFAEFGFTQEEFEMYFSEDLRKEDSMLEEEKVIEEACDGTEEIKESEEQVEEEKDNIEVEEATESEVEAEEKEEIKESDEQAEDEEGTEETEEKAEEEMSSEEAEETEEEVPTVEKLMAENEELRSKIESYMSQIEEMKDYEELKAFKADTLKKMEEEKEMAEMSEVFSTLQEKGLAMSKEVEAELTSKRSEFANINAWTNYVKAYAFDNCELNSADGIVTMELTHSISENNKSSWEILREKYN